MRISLKIVFYSIAFVFCTTNLSLAETPTDQEIRGLQALEDIQFTITSLAERVTPMVVNITPIREIHFVTEGFKRKGSYVARKWLRGHYSRRWRNCHEQSCCG